MAKKPILTPELPPEPPAPPAVTRLASPPAGGRDTAGHARPKTRITGYGTRHETGHNTGHATGHSAGHGLGQTPEMAAPAVGWLVITGGPGRGASCMLRAGMNAIGRGDSHHVPLDFGDDSISREAHAYVSYDEQARRFFVSHAAKTNLVRRNDAPVLATEPLIHGDTLRIGVTSLRFVALCGDDFDWSDP